MLKILFLLLNPTEKYLKILLLLILFLERVIYLIGEYTEIICIGSAVKKVKT